MILLAYSLEGTLVHAVLLFSFVNNKVVGGKSKNKYNTEGKHLHYHCNLDHMVPLSTTYMALSIDQPSLESLLTVSHYDLRRQDTGNLHFNGVLLSLHFLICKMELIINTSTQDPEYQPATWR